MTDYIIRFATKDDLDDIKKLWTECFNDSPDFINGFLNHFPENIDIIVCQKDNKVCSMASFLDVSANNYNGKYLFALATSRKTRKQHMASSIIEYAKKHYSSLGCDFLLTIPANSRLISFYDNLGFSNHTLKRTYIEEGTTFKIFPNPISPEELYQIRQNNANVTKFAEPFTNFLYNDLVLDGWMLLKYKDSYCVCKIFEGSVLVRESYGLYSPLCFANALGYTKAVINLYDFGEIFSQYVSFKNDIYLSDVELLFDK